MLRINPISAFIWWFLWLIPLVIGFRMYLLDQGLAWQRTEKIDANKLLIRRKLQRARVQPDTTLERGQAALLVNRNEDVKVE